jgi:hypothetical protein
MLLAELWIRIHFIRIRIQHFKLNTNPNPKKPSAHKRGHPTLQNMNFEKNFLLLWVIFTLLDPGPDSGSGFTYPIESGSGSATQGACIALRSGWRW